MKNHPKRIWKKSKTYPQNKFEMSKTKLTGTKPPLKILKEIASSVKSW